MQWRGLKIPIIVASMLAGIALIFALQWAHQKYTLQEPLNAALHGNSAVESYQISNEGRGLKVTVAFKYDADIREAYLSTRRDIARVLGRKPCVLVLQDSRDDALSNVWYESQFAVYQALARGDYRDMAAAVEKNAGAAGAEARIYVDHENLYVRLKHQGHTLDQVLSRASGPVSSGAPVSTGGGVANAQRN
jgi:hypothetical protein